MFTTSGGGLYHLQLELKRMVRMLPEKNLVTAQCAT
jgi:hypothetical protein